MSSPLMTLTLRGETGKQAFLDVRQEGGRRVPELGSVAL